MKIAYKIAAAAAMMAAAAPASAAVNLIKNGSFELGTDPGATLLHVNGPNTTTVTNWAVANNSQFSYVGDAYDAAAGSRSIDLSGVGGNIYQQVSKLTVGAWYSLSFSLSNRPGGTSNAIVRVSTTATPNETFTFTGNPVTGTDMAWQSFAYRFIAINNSQRFSFSNANRTADRAYGPVIDNVFLTTVVPEPATWAMFILGFGFVGTGMRSRNRHAVSA